MADVGRLLHPEDRDRLLAAIPPAYPRVVAHHVTLKAGVRPDFPLPVGTKGLVVGVADDGAGVQALVVEIGGTSRRSDGSTYHVTWSLAPGREAVESNDAIRERGWTAILGSVDVGDSHGAPSVMQAPHWRRTGRAGSGSVRGGRHGVGEGGAAAAGQADRPRCYGEG